MPDDFDELAAGLPDDRSQDQLAGWLEQLSTAANEEELFDRLASQRPPSSKLVRQQLRGRLVKLLSAKFKELDCGAAAAKTADAWLHEGEDADLLQGSAFVAEEIEPWGRPVVGAVVLDELVDLFDAYLYATEEQLAALALWVAYSHVFDLFGISPILDLSSPTKRCGKTTGCVVLRHLCRKALLSGNLTRPRSFARSRPGIRR